MYTVYILESLLIDRKYYIGHSGNLTKRFKMHNEGLVRSTKSGRPWKIIYTETFHTKNAAYKRELQIKSYKSGNAFKKIIERVGTKADNWT